MFLSVFEVFKIGIGPSSSHTMGPMTAANRFLDTLLHGDWPRPRGMPIAALSASLHGSLAFTGIGHGTDRAVILGLCGKAPDTIEPDDMGPLIAEVERTGMVHPPGHPPYRFRPAIDLVLDRQHPLPGHPNGMRFSAFDANGGLLLRQVYYSIGGGFVVTDAQLQAMKSGDAKTPAIAVPYPFDNARQMLAMAEASGLSIAEMKRANECAGTPGAQVDAGIENLWSVMKSCMDRGMEQDGQLPGGLKVRRRARRIRDQLKTEALSNIYNPLAANDWLTVYAMAVNEENAAGSRVVTAPTNGAAGVVPAVLRYYVDFDPRADVPGILTFLLTAAAIGGIIKHNASISGAEVGCQGEVGSASAMAAAGLCAVMGGTAAQIENAAEIALEHHLGMTCDPVGGLVQIPCIERNAFGAVKAVTAASLAMKGDGMHAIPLDACVETMLQTGADMHERYKETSLGGLAVNFVEC